MADIHITPPNDTREHTERRDCWCEPEIKWACGACCAPGVDKWPDGSPHNVGGEPGCPVCNGTGWVTRANGNACVVIHDAKDGRP